MADDPPLPPCLECGVCCFSHLPTYVSVTGDDYGRLGSRAEELVWFSENHAHMRIVDGRCAALDVQTNPRRFVCSAYDIRPTTCRALVRGSPACLGERASKAQRPEEAVTRNREIAVTASKGRTPA